jgi:hypothetical protein
VRSSARRLLALYAAVAAVSAAGCPLVKNTTSVRVEFHELIWPGLDLADLGVDGSGVGLEIAPGDASQPAMGPFYLGGVCSMVRMDDDTFLYRAGIRGRSSTLDRPTFSYPYAMVGVYAGWLDLELTGGKFGAGIEGGYGFRFGLGEKAAFDLEILFEYGYFEGAYSLMNTRVGGGLMLQF